MFNLLEILTPVMQGRSFERRTDRKRKARYLCYDSDTEQDVIIRIEYDVAIGGFSMTNLKETMLFEDLVAIYESQPALTLRCEVRQL